MTDVTQLSDEALVDAFTDSVMEVRCDGTGGDPSPIQRLQYQEQHTELLRRLRARSVEGLVGIKTEDLTEALQCMNRSQVLAEFRCREGQIDERTRDRWIAKVQRHIDSMLESAGWSKDRYKSNRADIGRALQSAAGETMIPLREAVRVVDEACMSERRRCEGDYYGDMYGGAAIDGVEGNAIAALQALGGGE